MAERNPRTVDLPRWPLVLLFAIFTAVAFWFAIDYGSPAPPPIDPDIPHPTPGPSIRLPLSLEDGAALAGARAAQWRRDARLILASAQLDWVDGTPAPNGLPAGGTLIYTFAGVEPDMFGRERFPVFTVMIGRESGVIFQEVEETVAVEPGETVELAGLPVDSAAAFKLAQRLAGDAYRAACPDLRNQLHVIFDTSIPGNPRWAVVYYDQRDAAHNDVVVRIDAVSGTPTVEADPPRPCAAG
ncbi:MAG: hypothetical protein M3121_01885 [Chloroflexota bacterium]|nr:hypothetical protein [Chloroflexota bacterium]